jgi:hypothetical protein
MPYNVGRFVGGVVLDTPMVPAVLEDDLVDSVCPVLFQEIYMLTTILIAVCLLGPIVVPAMAAGPRDAALAACNAEAIAKWSYHGTVYDKEDNRYAVYRTCMQRHGQPL